MDKPSRGDVYIDGKDIAGLTDKQLSAMRLEKTGSYHLALKPVDCLSGGELQRGCICRSLINNPSVLFADEPTGALNSRAAEKVMEIITAVHKSGTAFYLLLTMRESPLMRIRLCVWRTEPLRVR